MQFSLFGAAAVEPALSDLDGVLLGGGHWVRNATGARLSVVVDAEWRVNALQAVFAAVGVADEEGSPASDGVRWVARTAFRPELQADAARWTRGARQATPPALTITAGGLRLWAVVAGRRTDLGYLLGTTDADDARHREAGAALARLGLAAVSVTERAGGPGWRVTSARRLRRLAELVGETPAGAESNWPLPAG